MIITKDTNEDITKKIARHWKPSEIEVEVGLMFGITQTQFRRCLQYMLSIGDYHKEHDEVLDINVQKYRYSVSGRANISVFCKNEMTPGLTTVITKEKLEKIDIPEYGCRLRISKETNVESPPPLVANSDKTYRLKKRYSVYFDGGKYVVDFTIVKTGSGKVFSKTPFKPAEYEIEVEYKGGPSSPSIGSLLDYVEEVLKNVRDEVHVCKLSDRGSVVKEYLDIIAEHVPFNINDALVKSNPRKVFIGPQPVTLESNSIADLASGEYSVTEKADGQRYLLYINGKGAVYLVNNRMEVKCTMWTCLDFSKSILDCECTTLVNGEIHILVFDCYFSKGKVVFTKGLLERLDEAAKVVAGCSGNKTSGYSIIRCKKFYSGDVFSGAKEILKKTEFPYTTDGLIFTPLNMPAPLGGTWLKVWKWKPPQDNTIDFLVMFQRHDNGSNVLSVDGQKTLLLYVGSVSVGAKEYFEKTARGYVAKLFTPSNAGDYTTWKTEADRCTNNEEIIHGSVVEFMFDLEVKKWIPLRVRHDKTAESQGGKNITANSMQNADAVWNTIVNPISEATIMGLVQVPAVKANVDDRYYARDVERDQSLTLPMVTFHNFWVKNKSLIARFNGKCSSLLDLACGKGGDLSKWIFGNFTTVLGVDIFVDNINSVDGVYKRLGDWTTRMQPKSKYAFLPLDSSRFIDEDAISDIKDDYMRQLGRVIWGFDKQPPNNLKHLAGMAKDKFDVVSVQFALHYFFESEAKLTGFIKNVDAHLKNGGFFIGTCFDGSAIADMMAGSDIKKGTKNGKLIWSIKKLYDKYDSNKLGQQIEVYVETINKHHVESLVNYNLLVARLAKYNIHPLTQKECAEYGFSESMSRFGNLFNRMVDENKSIIEKRDDPKYKDNNIIKAFKMSECEDERTFSFLNMAFVFRKGIVSKKK